MGCGTMGCVIKALRWGEDLCGAGTLGAHMPAALALLLAGGGLGFRSIAGAVGLFGFASTLAAAAAPTIAPHAGAGAGGTACQQPAA